VILALAFCIGTFPGIDNFAHLGGFVFGIVSAIVFLPYITFGLVGAVGEVFFSL
jgi:membrane associated rhomboid family serine protease